MSGNWNFNPKVRARICNHLWSPGIDSEETIPPAHVAWQAGTTNRVVVPARQAGNRFLWSLKGLRIRALLWYISVNCGCSVPNQTASTLTILVLAGHHRSSPKPGTSLVVIPFVISRPVKKKKKR